MSLQLYMPGLVLLLIRVSLRSSQNCVLYHVSSGQLLMPLWPCCSVPEFSLVVFSEKKNSFHYKIPLKPGFIFLFSSHMVLWLLVKCLQGLWCEAMNNIALNSKEFICLVFQVWSSQSSSCTGAICASLEVPHVRESHLCLFSAGEQAVPSRWVCGSKYHGMWSHSLPWGVNSTHLPGTVWLPWLCGERWHTGTGSHITGVTEGWCQLWTSIPVQ